MGREITERQFRNDSGEIMRALDAGQSFIVTRNGVPVGELSPVWKRRFVTAEVASAVFAAAPPVDAKRFRNDLDSVLDRDPGPRG